MQHSMKLLESPFEKIKAKKKIIEVRLFDKKRQQLNIGDTIEFSKLPELTEKLKVKITGLLRYGSFKDLVDDFGLEYYGYPKNYGVQEFLDGIYTIYAKEKEEELGVLGIKIELEK